MSSCIAEASIQWILHLLFFCVPWGVPQMSRVVVRWRKWSSGVLCYPRVALLGWLHGASNVSVLLGIWGRTGGCSLPLL
jgi:hypothetical protein